MFVEFKRPCWDLSAIQKIEKQKLDEMEQPNCVVHNEEELIELVMQPYLDFKWKKVGGYL